MSLQPARVAHKAFPEIPGVVEEVQPGAEPGTFKARVAWPEGAPIELTGNEWHSTANLEPFKEPEAEEYPVCPNCGERHPVPTPEQVLEIAKAAIIYEAFEILKVEGPEARPALAKAFAIAQGAQQEMAVQAFAAELDTHFPTAEEGTDG